MAKKKKMAKRTRMYKLRKEERFGKKPGKPKKFDLADIYKTEKEAERKAESYRMHGYFARTAKNKKDYSVYIR